MESFEPVARVLVLAAFALLFLWARRRGETVTMTRPMGDDASVEELLAAGRKVDAIKRHRREHGTGLREAKDAVERIARGLPD